MKKETEWDNIIVSKEKTDWMWVVQMLMLGALGIAMLYVGKYVDMQAKRIDYLEIENIKHQQALDILLPSTKEEVRASTDWPGKEH